MSIREQNVQNEKVGLMLSIIILRRGVHNDKRIDGWRLVAYCT